uniref:Uncharacterized protein n=1 Tax=Triticum urartu TaxID=4572 RepID=A0A8R7P8E5_TRIUA
MEKVEALEDMVSFVPSILINVSCVVLIESTGANFLMFFPTHTATLLWCCCCFHYCSFEHSNTSWILGASRRGSPGDLQSTEEITQQIASRLLKRSHGSSPPPETIFCMAFSM